MGQGELPNGVALVVDSCEEIASRTIGTQKQCIYRFKFSVTLPPPDDQGNYPAPSFDTNLTANFYPEEEPADTTRFSLFVNYQSAIPTTYVPSPENKTYSKLIYRTDWVNAVNRGAVTFIGTNIDPQTGKKIRAKSSTTVGQPAEPA